MMRCPFHIDPTKWINAGAVGDGIRVVCSLCGAFIGYRLPEDERRRKQRGLRKEREEDLELDQEET